MGACEGLNFPLLWRVFMPTYVFVGEGRCQCNVTPVQIELIIAVCVVPQPEVIIIGGKHYEDKNLDMAVCKKKNKTELINKLCNINKLNRIQLFNQCRMIRFKQSLKSDQWTTQEEIVWSSETADSYSDGITYSQVDFIVVGKWMNKTLTPKLIQHYHRTM